MQNKTREHFVLLMARLVISLVAATVSWRAAHLLGWDAPWGGMFMAMLAIWSVRALCVHREP